MLLVRLHVSRSIKTQSYLKIMMLTSPGFFFKEANLFVLLSLYHISKFASESFSHMVICAIVTILYFSIASESFSLIFNLVLSSWYHISILGSKKEKVFGDFPLPIMLNVYVFGTKIKIRTCTL